MKYLVVLCSLVAVSLTDGEPGAVDNSMDNLPLGLPFGLGYGGLGTGAISSTNVNVPGRFSYVVNSVHPIDTEDTVRNVGLPTRLHPGFPTGYGFNPYLGLRNNFFNPYLGAGGLYSQGRLNPYFGGYPYGYNGYLGYHGYNYPYGGLGYAPTVADQE